MTLDIKVGLIEPAESVSRAAISPRVRTIFFIKQPANRVASAAYPDVAGSLSSGSGANLKADTHSAAERVAAATRALPKYGRESPHVLPKRATSVPAKLRDPDATRPCVYRA